ncbi:MAG: TRAP transporter substrate-binding protein [Clostridium sp.]|nr:TRAP transporter substrate-binding protein [Clostridium sp.]
MRKLLSLSLGLILSAHLIGCNSTSTSEAKQIYAWPIATASPEDTVTQILAEKFAKEVDRLSDGKMQIEVYSNSVLGGDRELLESCKDGDIPFVVQNTAPQVSFIKEAAIFDLPCAFADINEVRNVVDNEEFLSIMKEGYRNSGYELMGYADQGFRVMSSNKRIEQISDFKSQKIRTMENTNHINFWRAIGASATPMTFSEVYIGLQQNTIDAQENPYEVIVSNKLHEQQNYIIETNHLAHLISLIVSEEFYKDLTEEQREIINEASQVAIQYARESSDSRISEKIEVIKNSGTEIIEISDELRNEMFIASEEIYNGIRNIVGSKLVNLYIGK